MGRANDSAIVLTGLDLTLEDVLRVSREAAPVELDSSAIERMRTARAVVERAIERGEPVYGLNTGVGINRRVRVDPADAAAAGTALLREHRVAQGPPASADVVRATMLLLANGFARAAAGVTPALAERFVGALNAGEIPRMRTLGSVGVADLGPLADLASEIFAGHPLAPGEALALLDSNAFGTAAAALAVADARALVDTLDVAGALALEAFAANLDHLHPDVGATRPFPGLQRSLARMRELLAGSSQWDAGASRNLQDPISFRSLPHVNGALHDAVSFAEHQLAIELNASQGNPVVVAGEARVVSVGNFDVAPVAQVIDLVRIALASAVGMSCERSLKLLDASWSGLPTGLSAGERPESLGIGMLGVAAQSLAVEARTLAQPVSHELVSTSEAEGTEDRTTMTPLGARRLSDQIALARRVVAIELAVAARALTLRASPRMGAGTDAVLSGVRTELPWICAPSPAAPEVEPLLPSIASGSLTERTRRAATSLREHGSDARRSSGGR